VIKVPDSLNILPDTLEIQPESLDGIFLALLVRPVWPVRRTGLTGLAWQSPILPSSRVKQW
jgi:hypothetical protein